jgi:Protein of unknown function (DUF3306)
MSEEDFLSRWSRRKREAEESLNAPAPPQAERPAAPMPVLSAAAEPTTTPEPEEEFDLSTLPPIDSITKATDITAFLRKGVPLELSRAALRCAWVADPAIRDFVGLAENAWDFNDPNAMPGFGPLDQSPEQVRRLVERIVGGVRGEDETPGPAVEEVVTPARPEDEPSAEALKTGSQRLGAQAEPAPLESPTQIPVPEVPTQSSDVATQNEKLDAKIVRRTHGGALPR